MNGHNDTTEVLSPDGAQQHAVEVRSLDEHLSSDHSFGSAYARAVGALAASDGAVTLAQFAALTDIAGDGKASAVFTALVLNAIESGVNIDWALNGLARSHADQPARDSAFSMALPLLALQGAQARPLAQRLAKSLNVKPSLELINRLPDDAQRGMLANLGLQARKLVKGRTLADSIADVGRSMGLPELVDLAQRFQCGLIDRAQLQQLVRAATDAVSAEIAQYQEQARTLMPCEVSTAALASAALELKRQVQQRLTLIDARIAYERGLLVEEIDDAIHDAGNAIELAITDRLDTDKWKNEEVWSSIGRNQFGVEMERRLDRVIRRKEEALRLLQEDLKLFQASMRLGEASVFQRQHRATLTKLMPRLRIGTRLANKVETAANVTLMGSAVAAAGTGTAAYLFGAAAILPAIAPVAPFVGGAMLLAGVFKWFSDSGKRKRSEIRDKRSAFEDALRQQLRAAELSFNDQLDQIAAAFHASAQQLLAPIMLEAEAAGRVQGMRQRIAERVIKQARLAIAQLDAELSAA